MNEFPSQPLLVSPEIGFVIDRVFEEDKLKAGLHTAQEALKRENLTLWEAVSEQADLRMYRFATRHHQTLGRFVRGGFTVGALAGYMALSLEGDAKLPYVDPATLRDIIDTSPPTLDNCEWHFAVRSDKVLSSILGKVVATNPHTPPLAAQDGMYSGAGLVSHVFNQYYARLN